jgi:hypothetical protein
VLDRLLRQATYAELEHELLPVTNPELSPDFRMMKW